MYSGSDSTGSQNINQWPLNPAAYQNTPNEQIDWAALAQQWIIMKEAGPPVPDQVPTAPPPPIIQKVKKDHPAEGGEAPMEVENEKEDDTQPHWNDNNSSTEGSWNWNQQQHWGWGNTWSTPSGVPPPGPGAPKTPLLPTPPSYNQFSGPSDNTSNFGGYNRTPSEYSGGYWTASGNKMKPHNKRYSKVNVPPRPPVSVTTPDPVMLDASKRKQLPAWIREGLEKMERDKQRQIEKEREKQEKEEQVEKSKLNEKEALEIIKSTVKERERSKFESDGDDSESENIHKDKGHISPEITILTQEELMRKVRRTMTEILLKVTNQEIRAVCKEEFQRHLRKHKASDLRVSAPSGTNISARLGLGMYGDSASSSEDSGDESEQEKDNSDAELKDTIKRRKAEFSKTEREIEERLAAAEKHVDEDSRGGTPKADSCDSQVDAKAQGYKGKSHEDSTPPKLISSTSKRLKARRASTSSSAKSDSENEKHAEQREKKIIRNRKSTSSESNHSQKFSKTRNKRSSNRSVTPERKRIKGKSKHSSEAKIKYSESSSSKSSSSRSRRSRSKSIENRKRKRSTDKSRKKHAHSKNYYSKRSPSRSSSRSRRSRSRSYTRSHRSESRDRRSRSQQSDKSRKSRSRTRSERSRHSRSRTRSERSRKSHSQDRRSRSQNRNSRTPRSRRRSRSFSPQAHRHRRLKSRSRSRGKRSHRH